MTTPPISVAGTPQGFWTRWVDGLLSRVEHAGVAVQPGTPGAQGVAAGARPATKALVLVEHPAIGLARVLAEGGDPGAWLDEWLASGRALLAHVHREPDACLLVNADDARRHPEQVASLLQTRWGESSPAPLGDVLAPSGDVLADALAWSFVDRNLAVQHLAEELLASCVLLPGDVPISTALVMRGAVDGVAVARRYAELVESEQRAARVPQLEQAVVEAQARISESDRQHASLSAQLDEAAAQSAMIARELDTVRDRLARAEQQRVDLEKSLRIAQDQDVQQQERLEQVLQDLETSMQARRTAGAQVADAAKRARAARKESDALRRKLSAARAQVAEIDTRLGEATRALSAEQARVTTGEQALEAAHVERDLQKQQLFRLREELSQMSVARHDAEARAVEAEKRSDLLRKEVDGLRGRIDGLKSEAETLDAKLQQAAVKGRERDAALSAACAERDAQRQRADESARALGAEQARVKQSEEARKSASEESELLLQQLHQVQEELEQTFLARRDAENALHALKAGLDPSGIGMDLKGARDECELMGLQMDQVQRELERVHAEKLKLARDVAARVVLPGLEDVSIGTIAVTGERDTPPHREISFVVRDVRVGSRQVAEASVRLVEHWGRPGLAVFANDADEGLFSGWCETGREDSRPYMLLVHGEESAQRVLDSMGTLDWQLVQALVVRMQQALRSTEAGVSPTWAPIAQRLLASLQDQPARLRHEQVRVAPVAPESPEVSRWSLVLERASFRSRTWPRLTIHWRPDAVRPSIELLADAEGGPPLLAWPADEDGVPARALRLPVGEDPNAPEIRGAWSRVSGADKAFVAELLGLMPSLADHVQASAVGDPVGSGPAVDLQASARTLAVLGRAALDAPSAAPALVAASAVPGGQLLRRLGRRLRAAAATPAPSAAAARAAVASDTNP